MDNKPNSTWHSVHDCTPCTDEEVIVLDGIGRISFAHMVDPCTAVSYDGWNIPDVVFWRPCDYTPEVLEYYGQ